MGVGRFVGHVGDDAARPNMHQEPVQNPTHPTVVMARNTLIVCGLLGAWMIWLVVALPPNGLVIAGSAVPLLAVWLLDHRQKQQLKELDWTLGLPARLAWVPVICVVVAFLGYGVTLTLVHGHYYDTRTRAFTRAAHRVEDEVKARSAKLTKEEHDVLAKERHLLRRERHLSHEEKRVLAQHHTTNRREAAEVATLVRTIKAGGHNRRRLISLLQHAEFANQGPVHILVETLLLASIPLPGEPEIPGLPHLPAAPNASELPPWFGQLGNFFTVATQILAGLVIVLAFGRWRRGASEGVWRTAMPVAGMGIAFGLAGNLPSLSRSLQAILLAPVIAGLAGAIGGLIVVTMDSRPPHDGSSEIR